MLAGILLLQQAVTASIPHRDGLTIVQAIAGDTLRGSARGDYEATIVVTDFASHGVEFFSRAFVRNDAGQRAWLSVRSTERRGPPGGPHPDPRLRHPRRDYPARNHGPRPPSS